MSLNLREVFRSVRGVIFFLILVSSPLWISRLWWELSPELPLRVRLVDYTVPFDNYAEHHAALWSFNHLKLIPPRGAHLIDPRAQVTQAEPPESLWSEPRDYIGPEPFNMERHLRLHEAYTLNEINQTLPYDLVYIADTYGVYYQDFMPQDPPITANSEVESSTLSLPEKGSREKAPPHSLPAHLKQKVIRSPDELRALFEARRLSVHMDFSQLLFGGLSDRDLDVLEAHTQAGGDLFFEFNSFCDPTPSAVRQRAEKLIGLEWTGWSGRYLKDPHDPEDTPHWLPRLYRQQYPGQELPHQPSLLLAHRDSRVFLITSENPEEILPTLNLRPEMSERFAISNTPYYHFWFAVMRPPITAPLPSSTSGVSSPRAHILAEIELHAPDDQRSLYQKLGIPLRIPLLTEARLGPSHRYYLSIDGSDMREDLGVYSYAGVSVLQSIAPRNRGVAVNQRQVFWQFYLPMLRSILWERSSARYPRFPEAFFSRLINRFF